MNAHDQLIRCAQIFEAMAAKHQVEADVLHAKRVQMLTKPDSPPPLVPAIEEPMKTLIEEAWRCRAAAALLEASS